MISSQSIEMIVPHHVHDTRPFYSHIVSAPAGHRLIMFAGQVGRDVDGRTPTDFVEQVELAYRNLSQCLQAAGAKVTDIMKLTYYIVNYNPEKRLHREPTNNFLQGHLPAATLIPVPALASPEFLFEVECTAAIPEAPLRNVDVVVVGAGLSGLQAALNILKAGYSVVVVEARGRVGGKTWSQDIAGGKQDVGAAWINDTNQSRMWALSQHYGLETVVQNTEGRIIMQDPVDGAFHTFPYGGVPEREGEKGGVANMVMIRDLFENLCLKVDLSDPVATGQSLGKDYDNMSLAEFAIAEGGSKLAQATVNIWTKAMLGLESRNVSCLFFMDYCKGGGGIMQMRSDRKDGGQFLRLVKGTQSFSLSLAETLGEDKILLSSPVRNITQVVEGVHVSSARGSFLAKRVIVSVPTPTYHEISFSPPLSPAKLKLSQSTLHGYTAKMIMAYKEPWWRAHDLCGLQQSDSGTFCITRDTSVDSQQLYALTCFAEGDAGLAWSKLSAGERKSTGIAHIRRAFGPFVGGEDEVPDPIETIEQEWWKDQWSQGCPAPAMPPSLLTECGHALRSAEGAVHFVGTETAYEWKGYMEGAVRSGERGAEEVIRALKG